ncbi:MAG: hypothetical protein U0871_16660 [Gemmataceae bacterium]
MRPDPHAEYAARHAARRAAVAELDAQIDRLGRLRLGLFGAAVLVALIGGVSGWFPAGWAFAGALPLVGLLVWGKAVGFRRDRAMRAVSYYAHALDRLAGKWAGRGPTGDKLTPPDHPFVADLDLFGDGSLFQRLCSARTAAGQRRLADWLLHPAAADEVRSRQAAVADLRDRPDLREYLALSGGAVESSDLAPLAGWGTEPRQAVPGWRRTVVFALGWFNVAAVLAWAAGLTALPLVVGLLASLIVAGPMVGWARKLAWPVEEAANDLPLLEAVLARLEQEVFTSPRLVTLQQSLTADGRPSVRVRELRSIAEWSTARRNPMFLPVAVLLMWDVRTGLLLDAWRAAYGDRIGRWLDAVAELEALSSLAGYAFENPSDPFPDLLAGPPTLLADGLAHPLLPADRAVRNPVALGGDTGVSLLLVSGSNMSGKSTLLRAVGVNVALALAGGPVRAERLALTPVRLGATMRVQDSLADGKSRFFAEVTRVRDVLALAGGDPPVLFLFDELFAGTNSADRLAGAEAVIRTLLGRGAIGFVTTHDLALTAAVERLGGVAANVHFEDQIGPDGGLRFDYTVRPGVVPHGNGVALMRAVGLEV